MPSDGVSTLRWAAGIQAGDRGGHLGLQLEILTGTTLSIPLTPPGSRRLIGKTLSFGVLKRGLLDQNPLAFIAATGTAETHHDRRQAADPSGTPRQRGIA